MPPAIFRLVPALIALMAAAMALFPKRLSRWQMHGPDGTTTVEPSGARLLMMRIVGAVIAIIGLLMAFGGPMAFFYI
ncbi:hypothetical protein ELS19_08840 [Halogeometricum borinquense]|uniref:DUF6199 domain-containing protein n=1 Tax=Halogeometricum borinquense TaxID=60847 RepID=A0A482TMC6_9EURY|nr:hypothetical protein [Halogeometricum borinquense]RYJ14065.1 hypothetical protein ELS19_08840 [Halogeometricum borinquense]